MTPTPALFAHVLALSDGVGIFEHALFSRPRIEHGYCVDDVARALVAVCRYDPFADDGGSVVAQEQMDALAATYLAFLEDAQTPAGLVVNRRSAGGDWSGQPGTEDCWGRALWAFGTAAARSHDLDRADRAARRFTLGATQRSDWPRAMAFAGLGAAELMRVDPGHAGARALLRDAATAVGTFRAEREWPWPEDRLTYANAVLPDVLMAAGDSLGDDALVADGLEMLGWLVDVQQAPHHLSLTPAAGWAGGEPMPAYDQQPIESATLADACARAFELTGDARWAHVVELAAAWFFGRNDTRVSLYDEVSGGCCDGLELIGRNENQGAESTLALVTTVQHAGRLVREQR